MGGLISSSSELFCDSLFTVIGTATAVESNSPFPSVAVDGSSVAIPSGVLFVAVSGLSGSLALLIESTDMIVEI